jgi:hypothetical protein
VLEKLLEILVAAKAGALSGVLLVAGTLVTVTAGGGVTIVELEDHASSSPSLEVPIEAPDDDADEEDEEEPEATPPAGKPVALKPETSCSTAAETARTEARERLSSAFVTYRNALDELRASHRSERAKETLERAEAMLREIADKADRALAEMCDDVAVVADRAIAAMETVVNLARTAAEATPTPKPTEKAKPKATKPTEKPRSPAKATAKPSRTPSCDDRLYESKLKVYAAFERYHALHDKLYFAYKRSGSPIAKTVLANDELMHRTYDEAKHAILSSGCAGDLGAGIAARAAATFERAYQSSAQAVAAQGR